LKGGYSEKCDVWSLGVIAYILICGVPPFGGKNDAAILEKVKAGVLVFKTKVWDTVTEEGKTFIKNMLTLDVDERYSSKAALEDPWIANSAASATPVIRGSDSNYLKSLENFHKGNRLQKMSRHIVAMHISDSHIVKLKDLFMAMDKNNDGTLTLEEVKQGLSQSGVEEWDDMDATLEGVDTDGSGVINYTEFLAATLTTRQRAQEDACWAAFRHFDHDRNGSITKEELREAMKDLNGRDLQVTEAEVTRVIEEVDTNGDGVIKFDEFMDMMRQQMVAPGDLGRHDRLLKTKTIVDEDSWLSRDMDSQDKDISPEIE